MHVIFVSDEISATAAEVQFNQQRDNPAATGLSLPHHGRAHRTAVRRKGTGEKCL